MEEAQYRISLKVENEQLLPGLKKELIESLLGESTCLCGHHIGDAEREVLTGYIRLFPPLSYKSVYDQFKNAALRWGGEHNPKLLSITLFQYFITSMKLSNSSKKSLILTMI